jgi:hypothetical protein
MASCKAVPPFFVGKFVLTPASSSIWTIAESLLKTAASRAVLQVTSYITQLDIFDVDQGRLIQYSPQILLVDCRQLAKKTPSEY